MEVAEHLWKVFNLKTDENINLATISYQSGLRGYFLQSWEKKLVLTFCLSICRAKPLWFQFRLAVFTNLTLLRQTRPGKMEIGISFMSVSHTPVPVLKSAQQDASTSLGSSLAPGLQNWPHHQSWSGRIFSHHLFVVSSFTLKCDRCSHISVPWCLVFFSHSAEKPWLWVPRRLCSIFVSKLIFMDNFKGFCTKLLKVLSRGYDRRRQWIDYEMKWEIFFCVYLFLQPTAHQHCKEWNLFAIRC